MATPFQDGEDTQESSKGKELTIRKFIDDIYEAVAQVKGYAMVRCTFEGQLCLIITHEMLYHHPPFGMTSRCRISVKAFEYVVHVLMREVERGFLKESAVEKVLLLCEKYSSDSKIYKFCPGLDISEYEGKREIIRFDVKAAHKTSEPFLRVDSVKCLLWHKLGMTASSVRKEASCVMCPPCVRLKCDIEHQARRTKEESPSKKKERQDTSSRARLSYMSPESRVQRQCKQAARRFSDKRKLEHFEATEVPLDAEQDEEMSTIVSKIEETCPDELEKLFSEGNKHGVGSKLRSIWSTDRQREYADFSKDQKINSKFN